MIDIDISERGLAYGDGHFTTALITNGKIEYLDFHLARLERANNVLGLTQNVAPIDSDRLVNYLNRIISGYDKAVVKIMITAGAGGRGYARVDLKSLNVYVLISSAPSHYENWRAQGIHLGLSQFVLSSSPILAGIKHLNRLEQVLIRESLEQCKEQDMLVCDMQGHIIEASCANVFWYKNKQWYTPKLTTSGVDGVYRQVILSTIKGINVGHFTVQAFVDVEAMFICNSIMGIMPVKQYRDIPLSMTPVAQISERLK